jgi:hypothetical protein
MVGISNRQAAKLMAKADNGKLASTIRHMYHFDRTKPNVYEGGVANMLRLERLGGAPLRHKQAAEESALALAKLLRSGRLSSADRKIALRMRSDLFNAMAGNL